MTKMLTLAATLLAASTALAQTCPCTDLNGYECSVRPNFVLGDGTVLVPEQVPTKFAAVSPGATEIGGVLVHFAIGAVNTSTKFTIAGGGECAGTSGVKTNLPGMVSSGGRALTVSGRNPLYCHEATRDLICFSVKGQVGGPFPTLPCTPDRVEFVCGVVS